MPIVFLLLLLLMMSCRGETPPKVTPPQLQNFIVSNTAQNGIVPSSLIVRDGASITFTTYDADAQLLSEPLGVNVNAKKGEKTTFDAKAPPGTYVITCPIGCPSGKDTLSIEVR